MRRSHLFRVDHHLRGVVQLHLQRALRDPLCHRVKLNHTLPWYGFPLAPRRRKLNDNLQNDGEQTSSTEGRATESYKEGTVGKLENEERTNNQSCGSPSCIMADGDSLYIEKATEEQLLLDKEERVVKQQSTSSYEVIGTPRIVHHFILAYLSSYSILVSRTPSPSHRFKTAPRPFLLKGGESPSRRRLLWPEDNMCDDQVKLIVTSKYFSTTTTSTSLSGFTSATPVKCDEPRTSKGSSTLPSSVFPSPTLDPLAQSIEESDEEELVCHYSGATLALIAVYSLTSGQDRQETKKLHTPSPLPFTSSRKRPWEFGKKDEVSGLSNPVAPKREPRDPPDEFRSNERDLPQNRKDPETIDLTFDGSPAPGPGAVASTHMSCGTPVISRSVIRESHAFARQAAFHTCKVPG